MDLVLLAAGILLIAVTMLDALWTTLWAIGHAGPLSRLLAALPRRLTRNFTKKRHHALLSAIGPATLIGTVAMWLSLLWIGWSLVFLADPDALVRSTGTPVESVWDVFYYAGFTIFSLGVGDIYATTPAWQMATVVSVANGLFIITLAVSYIISVVSSVVTKRAFATNVLTMGRTPAELVQAIWEGDDTPRVADVLDRFSSSVNRLGEEHFSYPILHAYRPIHPFQASPVAIAILDEALTIAEHGLREELRPGPLAVKRLRRSIDIYLDSLDEVWAKPVAETPPAPSLQALAQSGLAHVSDETFARAVAALADRRRRLAGLVETRWSWDTVASP